MHPANRSTDQAPSPSGAAAFFDGLVAWFFPARLIEVGPEEIRRARIAISTLLIVAIAALVYTAIYAVLFANIFGASFIFFCAAMLIITAFAFRLTGSISLSSHMTAATIVITIIGVMYSNGGSVAPCAPMMSVVSLAVLLVGGRQRVALTWMGIGMLTLVGVYLLQFKVAVPNYVPSQFTLFNSMSCNIGIVLVIYSIMLVFKRGERDALKRLDTARRAAEGEAVRIDHAARLAAEAERKQLADRVADMLVAMERFAAGDLTVRVVESANAPESELGRLYNGFNRAINAVGHTIATVAGAAESAAVASEQIRASTMHLTASAEEQATQTTRIVSSVQGVLDGVVRSADGALHAATVAWENGTAAQTGGDVVRETMAKITEIAGVVAASVEAVDRLGASGRRIRDVSNTIKQVASQTRMLALNAAVEAARAGEQGAGFAVVAEEVRRLATLTADATQQISDLVREVELETDRATQKMRESDAAVSESLRLASHAQEALGGIVAGTQETATTVRDIAASSRSQSAVCRTISSDVETVGASSTDAVARLANVAEAVDELAERGRELRALVRQFTFPDARVIRNVFRTSLSS